MAKTMLQENQWGEVMSQCENELRVCSRLANKSNRLLRASVNSLAREGSDQECKSLSSMTLVDFQEEDITKESERA